MLFSLFWKAPVVYLIQLFIPGKLSSEILFCKHSLSLLEELIHFSVYSLGSLSISLIIHNALAYNFCLQFSSRRVCTSYHLGLLYIIST